MGDGVGEQAQQVSAWRLTVDGDGQVEILAMARLPVFDLLVLVLVRARLQESRAPPPISLFTPSRAGHLMRICSAPPKFLGELRHCLLPPVS